ncbi:hypothetical protein ACIPL1_18370 [Pseudomonas sp. NPDC090202]|uniref:hypothetical protein n=1 Tax=unclassified Pseudomonas TaxID=196821 RepID=UPI0037F44A25
MNTFIPLEKLAHTDLNDFHEVWLTTQETYPQDPSHAYSRCLWRADRILTADVAIDDEYFQDLPCLWLKVGDLDDTQAVEQIEQILRDRLEAQHVPGQFHPGERPDTHHACDARDLRS